MAGTSWRLHAVDARPLSGFGDQAFLGSMPKQVAESSHLVDLVVTDGNGQVSSSPEFILPALEPVDLFGDIAIDVFHEVGQCLGILGLDQKVEMVRDVDGGADRNPVQTPGPSEDSEDDVVEFAGGSQKKSTLHRAGGDLDQTPLRDEA